MNTSLLEKIRKLRALATSSNVHEAAAAAAAADRLIQEHRVSEAELEGDSPSEVGSGEIYAEKGRAAATWRSALGCMLAKQYGCATILTHGADGTVRMLAYGSPSDLEIVRFMFAWLVAEATRLVESATVQDGRGATVRVRGRTARNSWFLGFYSGVREQLAEAKRQSEARAHAAGQSRGLVHLHAAILRAEDARAKENPHMRTRSPSIRNVDGGALASGESAGRNVHLGKALSVSRGRLLSA